MLAPLLKITTLSLCFAALCFKLSNSLGAQLVPATNCEKSTWVMTFPAQGQEHTASNDVFRLRINPEPFCLAKCPCLPPQSKEEIKGVKLFQGSKLSCGRGRSFCCFGCWPKPVINPILWSCCWLTLLVSLLLQLPVFPFPALCSFLQANRCFSPTLCLRLISLSLVPSVPGPTSSLTGGRTVALC